MYVTLSKRQENPPYFASPLPYKTKGYVLEFYDESDEKLFRRSVGIEMFSQKKENLDEVFYSLSKNEQANITAKSEPDKEVTA